MKSATQKAWLLGLVIVTAAPAALGGQKVLTFDAPQVAGHSPVIPRTGLRSQAVMLRLFF